MVDDPDRRQDLPLHEDGEPITRLEEVRAPHNVVAAFDGLRSARAAIERLEGEGVDGGNISLLGAQRARTAEEVSEAASDEPQASVGLGSVKGGLVGAGLGGAAGLIVGVPGIGPVVAAGLWAILGSGIGAVIGGVSSVGLSQAWEHTFDAVKRGNVVVGVHTEDLDEAARRAEEVLAALGPLTMNRFDD